MKFWVLVAQLACLSHAGADFCVWGAERVGQQPKSSLVLGLVGKDAYGHLLAEFFVLTEMYGH